MGPWFGPWADWVPKWLLGLIAMRWPSSRGRIWSWSASLSRPGGQIMKMLTRAELFGPPKRTRRTRKTKDWFERAKLVVAAARDRAAETTQQRVVPSMKSFPTVVHRRRLAERLGARS